MAERKVFRISELSSDDLTEHYTKGFGKGLDCGFYSGDRLMSYKMGYHTLIYAHPFSGKTQFAMQEAIYLSKKYGTRHLVYFPENGRKEEVVGDLLMIYLGQKMYGDDSATVDLQELQEAIKWLDQYFLLLAPEDGVLTLKDAYNEAHIWKVNMLWIDHFGYITKDPGEQTFGMADYVKGSLQFMLRAGLKLNIHTVMMAHIRDVDPMVDKDTGIKYMPKPHPSDIAGGQQNWNNGYQLIGIWRAPEGIIDPEGMPYEHNEMHIMVQKSKPKGIGRVGTFKLYFDESKQQVYEVVDGSKYFNGEYDAWHGSQSAGLPKPKWSGKDLLF